MADEGGVSVTSAIEAIQWLVAARYGYDQAAIVGRRRDRACSEMRQVAMAVAREVVPEVSLPQLGALFSRDHTTVMYSLEKMRRLKGDDLRLSDTLADLIRRAARLPQVISWKAFREGKPSGYRPCPEVRIGAANRWRAKWTLMESWPKDAIKAVRDLREKLEEREERIIQLEDRLRKLELDDGSPSTVRVWASVA